METKMKLKVKKFFFGFITFAIILNLIVSKKEANNNDYNNFNATFNKIDGVNVGTDVVISGIKVGQVQKIFLKDSFPKIFVSVKKRNKDK